MPNPGSPRLSLPLWNETYTAPPLPMTREEMAARGWDAVDVVFVTGDAYVDHPSFAMAILGRVLRRPVSRRHAQPADWHSRALAAIRAAAVVFRDCAGNMDSLINHYTANRKVRNDDALFTRRPHRRVPTATLPYCHASRGFRVPDHRWRRRGVASALAHYDYWSDKVRRSILLDAADLLVYGMGEQIS